LDGIHAGYHTVGFGTPPTWRAHNAIASALNRKRKQLAVDYQHRCLSLEIRGGVAGIDGFRTVALTMSDAELHPVTVIFAVFADLAELIDDRSGLTLRQQGGTEPKKLGKWS
ncbi:MAG: hypothetical protein AAFX94_21795, partial [Myxococcota bacterium]